MPRIVGGSQSQPYLMNMGSQSEASPSSNGTAQVGNSSKLTPANLSIAMENPIVPRKKIQLKSTSNSSFRIPRVSSGESGDCILGGRTYDSTPCLPKRNISSQYRAAEQGKGDLLPLSIKPSPPRNRSRTSSEVGWGPLPASLSRAESITRSLRSRGKRTSLDGESTTSMDSSSHHPTKLFPLSHSYSESHDKPPLRGYMEKKSFLYMKNSNFIQMLAVLALTCMVWESYHRAIATSDQFERLKYEESMMMLHLQRIEQHAIQLHENLGRMNDGSASEANTNHHREDAEPIDSKLIHAQTQQLYQMEEELNHELRGLQSKLQHVARSSIVKAFGEGPIQVSFDLDFGDPKIISERISISLWYDTPYAAWTLIEQVQNGLWTGSQFKFDKGLSISALPSKPEEMNRIDFVEKSQKTHEAWTVGLSEYEGGGMSLFINLQDNTAYRKHDVCIGKVSEGFGALQKLVESTRRLEGKGKSVTIKDATVSRMKMAKNEEGYI